MRSLERGKNTSGPEITNLSAHGFWILLSSKEYFLPFEQFPWFKDARISQIMNVKLVHKTHLYWPDLDVDLSVAIIEHPDRYRLTAKGPDSKASDALPSGK